MKKITIITLTIMTLALSVTGQLSNQEEFDKLKISLLQNLKKCYEIAKKINQSNDQWDIESYKTEGNKYYNLAYQDFLKIQDPKYDLANSKTSIISRALKYYANGFNNIGSLGGPYEKEREEINENLDGWPHKETESEKDANEGIFKLEIERQSAMAVQLPSKGTWCLWEIQGGNRVWLEGNVPGASNGYGKYDVYSKQLPMYLGDEKKFTLTNTSIASKILLVFKKCEYK